MKKKWTDEENEQNETRDVCAAAATIYCSQKAQHFTYKYPLSIHA